MNGYCNSLMLEFKFLIIHSLYKEAYIGSDILKFLNAVLQKNKWNRREVENWAQCNN